MSFDSPLAMLRVLALLNLSGPHPEKFGFHGFGMEPKNTYLMRTPRDSDVGPDLGTEGLEQYFSSCQLLPIAREIN